MFYFFRLQFSRLRKGLAPVTLITLAAMIVSCIILELLGDFKLEIGKKVFRLLTFNFSFHPSVGTIFPGIFTFWLVERSWADLLIDLIEITLLLPSIEQGTSSKGLIWRLIIWNSVACCVGSLTGLLSGWVTKAIYGASAICYGAAGCLGIRSATKKIWGISGWVWSLIYLSECLIDLTRTHPAKFHTSISEHAAAWAIAFFGEWLITQKNKSGV